MAARFDHLVVAVDGLDEAASRWRAAGIPAEPGGAHPVGTENVLVRGPGRAYVELIGAGSDRSNPWLDRVRSARGPISWAIAVDDIDAARAALVTAGLDPRPPVSGSRRTPSGELVEWRVCDLADRPYDDALPFLIEWTTPMAPGPADGASLETVFLTPPDPDRVADVLIALGFIGSEHWPRRVFDAAEDRVTITLAPLDEPVELEGSAHVESRQDGSTSPKVALSFDIAAGDEVASLQLDGIWVSTRLDRRRFPASSLLPAVEEAFALMRGELADWPDPHPGGRSPLEEEYSRCEDPEKYRLLVVRADAWIEAITAAGLGTARSVAPASVQWVGEQVLDPTRVTVVRGAAGTQPIVVGVAASQSAAEAFVQVGVGDPAHVLDRQPDCGCDACDNGSADLLDTLDNSFVLALSGGVYVVRTGTRAVTCALDGWSGNGVSGDEAERWLAEAAGGRRTEGVVAGEPWLS